jgi:hypothetical protein
MEGSDFKFFAIVGLALVVGYFLVTSEYSNKKNWARNAPPPPEPTIQFVPKGTPGARTMQQISEDKAYEQRVKSQGR